MASEPLTLVSSMATREVLAELATQFERTGGVRVLVSSAGGVDVARRVRAAEAFDVVVLAANVIEQLVAEGRLVAGSQADLVRSGIAVAVRAGAPMPAIDSEQAVRDAVVAARTLSYSTGPSGTFLVGLFERWGILEQIRPRMVLAPPGVAVGSLVARGEAELGFQQWSELMHLPGITVLGPLPPEIQSITTFSAGIGAASTQPDAARQLLVFMQAPEAVQVKRRHGMEPAA